MPLPHPAQNSETWPHQFFWRFLTGHHLDGRNRTNATWFRAGTAPSHHVNWWSAKPRAHRMVWRWVIVGVPVGWFAAFYAAPVIRVNLVVFITGICMPYLIHRLSVRFTKLLPQRNMVVVREVIQTSDITELDDIQIPVEDMKELMDLDVTNEIESHIDVSAKPRKGRSS